MTQSEVNPYAAASMVDPTEGNEKNTDPSALNPAYFRVYFDIVLMIAVSGGLFGIAVVFFQAIREVGRFNGPASMNALVGIITACVFVFVIGFIFALIAAVPVVLVCGWLKSLSASPPEPWTPTSIRVFGSATGALSGFACLAVPGIFSMHTKVIVAGLIPAGFAALVVPLLLTRSSRRTQRSIENRRKIASMDSSAT